MSDRRGDCVPVFGEWTPLKTYATVLSERFLRTCSVSRNDACEHWLMSDLCAGLPCHRPPTSILSSNTADRQTNPSRRFDAAPATSALIDDNTAWCMSDGALTRAMQTTHDHRSCHNSIGVLVPMSVAPVTSAYRYSVSVTGLAWHCDSADRRRSAC